MTLPRLGISRLLTVCSLTIASAGASAQGFPEWGTVTDAEGRGIPYANVYVPALSVGTVTDLAGAFVWPAGVGGAGDAGVEVRVSSIGFRDTTLLLDAFRQNAGPLVLQARAYELGEATIVDRRGLGEEVMVGRRHFRQPLCWCTHPLRGLGEETAIILDAARATALEELHLPLRGMNRARLTVEVNLWSLGADDKPHTALQPEPIRVQIERRDAGRDYAIDLRPYRLTVEGRLAVSLELVDAPGGVAAPSLNLKCLCGGVETLAKDAAGRWYEGEFGGTWGGNMYLTGRAVGTGAATRP